MALLYGGAGLILLVLTMGLLTVRGLRRPDTSDAALRSRFLQHRAQFDSLVALAGADAGFERANGRTVEFQGTEWLRRRTTEPEAVEARRLAYGRLLGRTGTRLLMRSRQGGLIFVFAATRSRAKGLRYTERPVSNLVGSIDALERSGKPFGPVFMPLAPGWYIYGSVPGG